MCKFRLKKKSCIVYAQNCFTANVDNTLKIIKIERDVNEHSNHVI